MLLHIPEVLTAAEVAKCRQALEASPDWKDGRATAGAQSALVKRNLQLPDECDAARAAGRIVLEGLGRNPHFLSAALPKRVFTPLFNLYQGGQDFGIHVDNAIRQVQRTGERLRTDVSATLFLSAPDEYEGGELVVEDTYGTHRAKLPAGHLILYPATSLHRVTPVTKGARLCSFFWIESMVRDDWTRNLLFDFDNAIQRLRADHPEHDSLVAFTGLYHNLVRRWAET